jgi:hypothetical protein
MLLLEVQQCTQQSWVAARVAVVVAAAGLGTYRMGAAVGMQLQAQAAGEPVLTSRSRELYIMSSSSRSGGSGKRQKAMMRMQGWSVQGKSWID